VITEEDLVTTKTFKVKVQVPFRIVYEASAFHEGDTLSVPEHVAAEWERSGWVERVTTQK
jgi:hypothetical protein